MLSTSRFIQFCLIGLGLLALFLLLKWLLDSAVNTLLLVFAGILFATFVRGLSRFVFGRFEHFAERAGVLVTLLVLAGLCGAFIFFLAPKLIDQLAQLAEELPKALNMLREKYPGFEWLRQYVSLQEGAPPAFTDKITGRVFGVFATTFGVLASFFVVLVVGLYLCFSPYSYIDGIFRLIPPAWRKRADELFLAIDHTLGQWLIGRFVGMVVVGVSTYIGLLFLGIPLPLSLAVVAAVFTFIPNIGPILSAIPPVVLGYAESSSTALAVILLYAVIQALESYIITPLIQQRQVALPPVLTLTSQIVLASLFGFLGLMMATPLAAVVLVLVKMLYIEDVLGEPVDVPGAAEKRVADGEGMGGRTNDTGE